MTNRVWILLLTICCFITFLITEKCNREIEIIGSDTIVIRSVERDTILISKIIKEPVPYTIIKDSLIYSYIDIDTNAILKDYFSRYVYIDTLLDDTSALISIRDTISRNKIVSRELFYRNRRATVIEETRITNVLDNRQRILLGAKINNLGEFSPGIMYINKKGYCYTYNYNVTTQAHYLGIYFRIRKQNDWCK